MTELLTAAQMRAIEQAAIESGEVTGLELMERAGRGVVEAIFEEWPELAQTSHRAVVLCGPGNNGGDGFVVARLLKEWGWDVEVFLYGDPEKLPPDARVNYERWGELGEANPLLPGALDQAIDRAIALRDDAYDPAPPHRETNRGLTTIYVDALFGTGLGRPFADDLLAICREWSSVCYDHGIAVDMPSGLCSDSGRCVGGDWLWSRLVATFHAPKAGHYLAPNMHDVRTLRVVPLGIDDEAGEQVRLVEPRYLRLDEDGLYGSGLQKTQHSHKYSHGHALILSGGAGATGAARLAARGALRMGAGLVTLGVPPAAQREVSAQTTAVMQTRIGGAEDLEERLQDERVSALCLGPGLGLGAREAALVETALRGSPGPRGGRDRPPRGGGSGDARPVAGRATVLDADALTLLSRDADLFDSLHEGCVLTPHAGEFKRLFPDIAEKLDAPATSGPAYSKVDATREGAARAGCTVLFKGPDTVIAAPSGRCAINASLYERSAPWLATAGSGDVLAGFITGLLARGFTPFDAACTGAWLHTECALSFGPGLIAEDLPEELPKVFSALGL